MRHVLDQRIRYITAQLEIRLHYGSITSYNASGSGGKAEGGNRPPGEAFPPHDRFRAEYLACTDDKCREGVCEIAETVLKAATAYVAPVELEPEKPHERKTRILSKPGWPARDVAKWMQGSVKEVHRVREAAGLDPGLGLELPAVVEDRERVLALAERHCSVRQIADQVSVSKSTVQRILRDAA